MDTSMSSTDNTDDYLIEELNSNDVPESELVEFEETHPLEVLDIIADGGGNDGEHFVMSPQKQEVTEEALITKFVLRGEVELPDLYTKLEPEEECYDDEEEEELELPTTSALAMLNRGGANNEPGIDTTIDDDDSGARQRPRGGGTCRKRTVLSPALQGLMGEANLSYARGQIEMAEKICLEIIRNNPLASEPFFTLAEIYENRDTEKYLNFLTIAAHLNPHNRDQWIRIAEMHISKGNFPSARSYYTKAIKVLNKDYDLRLRKARLLDMMGESNAAMFAYLKMIPLVPLDRAELCLVTAKNVARHFHGLAKHRFALEAMESAYCVCAHLFSLEDLNLYMELLILNKSYAKVLRCLLERTTLELKTEQSNNFELISLCVIPDSFVPDFRAKLCVSLIHLRAHHLLGYLIRNIHQHIGIVDERLDLYIDIAEALMQEHKYAEAISLLQPITDGDLLVAPAFVWLRQAECLRHLNRTNEAIDSYEHVVELAPFCYEAKFTLSALLKQQGRHVEAVKALEQAEGEGQPLNARLLYERCVMLQQIGETEEFLEVGCALLARQSIQLRNREEMLAAANGSSFYNAESLKVILQMRNITEDTDKELQEYNKPQTENSDLTVHDEYQLFLELIRTAYSLGKYNVIERICFAMVTTKRFAGFHHELERIIILACYFNDDCSIAFSYLRELISKDPANTALWNLMSLLVQKGQDLRYHRYMRRVLERQQPACPRQMRLFMGHYHLHCSSYKYALSYYAPILKEQPHSLVALCIAVVFNQLSLQRKVLRKSAAVAQSIGFAHKYAELRSSSISGGEATESSAAQQEICYNIGRIYHQAGMTHLAMEYYERGLAAHHELIEANETYLGLRQEIAFNLHLIYRASGNLRKARQYLYQYCVV